MESGGRPAAPNDSSSSNIRVVNVVMGNLLKVVRVSLLVIGVIVVIDALLPEVPED